ncbi:MAG TPA: branched-chain amino acid transport system II carrier protein, partial [Candidatus Merdenecus merdavium]|nr:branched-chain amino acid transport system II carrier protein [Candidatus Merdenecus merdavium]
MKHLSRKNRILIGLTLFSMFFGAGNLIFPPFLGTQAGKSVWIAMAGFAFSAIGLPILGVAAVAKSGGLMVLGGRVHKNFAFIFTLLIYLSIGPGLAIPRTASTSFEMAVVPFIGEHLSLTSARMIYSVVFFTIAMALAMNPDKLIDRLGKILTPCLLTLILVLFIGSIMKSMGSYYTPREAYEKLPFVVGFLDGYQTMDTIAALNFGSIISINIMAKGVKEENIIVRETMKAGVIAGIVLIAVYGALAHIGALTSSSGIHAQNG